MSGGGKNCISHWFPPVAAAGLPVPETRIVRTDVDLFGALERAPEDETELKRFFTELAKAGDQVGWPLFLRSGHFSGKHSWKRTCHVPSRDDLGRHVAAIVEDGECSSIMGFPWDVWAVRRLLKTEPAFHAFEDLPIGRERRYFVDGGNVLCSHPYWPADAFDYQDVPNLDQKLRELDAPITGEVEKLTDLARCASLVLDGAWSVDFMWAEGRWFLIDMALAEESWHPSHDTN